MITVSRCPDCDGRSRTQQGLSHGRWESGTLSTYLLDTGSFRADPRPGPPTVKLGEHGTSLSPAKDPTPETQRLSRTSRAVCGCREPVLRGRRVVGEHGGTCHHRSYVEDTAQGCAGDGIITTFGLFMEPLGHSMSFWAKVACKSVLCRSVLSTEKGGGLQFQVFIPGSQGRQARRQSAEEVKVCRCMAPGELSLGK